ncbi:peptide MFS transporter [Lentibacillus salicampi]|uniref:Peptide MFS transporter n=1 Tax=Lentibacillus salicampi TaxID=175306 RepID=A0A4Y9ABA8_9BACI|nr:peptide MFS transporter [Lentibacillus salicampi]TFJ93199.1 peptide MFS transporter [Lentibacillus salicampi]
MSSNQQKTKRKGFFGHPPAMFTLFNMELWERFSYYGMKALVIYYMYYEVSQGGLGLSKDLASSIMSVYGSLVFLSGIIGGWVADRVFGNRNTLFWGAITIMLGHLTLSLPGGVGPLFIGMLFIILGSGLMKPNISNIVGDLYSPTSEKRDAAFSLFYMAVNIGAFVSPLIVGPVGRNVNFHLGFSLAAIGMAIGLIVYILTARRNIGDIGKEVKNPLESGERKTMSKRIMLGTVAFLFLVLIAFLTDNLTVQMFINFISVLGVAIPASYFIMMITSKKTTDVERSRIYAYIPLFVGAMMFWTIQEQGAVIMARFADQRTQLEFLDFNIDPAWFQSVNPLFIILFAPVFATLWTKLGSRQPSTPHKFTIGIFLAGMSFLLMTLPGLLHGTDALASPLWLVGFFFLVTMGELCLSPVGLSATTKLAPKAFAAQTMSVWGLANAAGQGINAQITPLYGADTEIAYFGIIGMISVVIALILLFLSPKISSYMRGLH